MPKIVKTAKSSNDVTSGDRYKEIGLNAAKAIAAAIGTSYVTKKNNDLDSYYYIPTKNIGYPGWCINIRAWKNGSVDVIDCMIKKYDDNANSALEEDSGQFVIGGTSNSAAATNTITLMPVTCVLFKDSENNAVSIGVHNGVTDDGSDVITSSDTIFNLTMFFAKDVNNEVLCGAGHDHIQQIRTENAKMFYQHSGSSTQAPFQNINGGSVLHLTKMVNYLSPSYAEMKNAYVSVCRPYYGTLENRHTESLYVNGKIWGRAGKRNNDAVSSNSLYGGCYYPFEPYIQY